MPSDDPVENSKTFTKARWPLWVVTLGGAGLLRPAPGTWGSLAAILFLSALRHFSNEAVWPAELIGGIFLCGVLNVWFGTWIENYFGREDPGPCVIDEGAGVCLTLLGLPMGRPWATFIAAFVAFRIFDVLKPPPARQLEHLPRGWGILMDDLAAAVYANLLCQVVLRILIRL